MILFCFNIILILKYLNCNMLNVKLSNSQLNKLKFEIKKWNWSNFKSFIKFDQKFQWSSAANKGWSMVNYHQSSAFDCPYLSCNAHCDQWLFQEIFFLIILFLFPRNSFDFFYLFILTFFTFLHFWTAFKHTGWFCSLFACCFAITVCSNALHLFVLGQVHQNKPLNGLFMLSIFHINVFDEA